MLPTRSLLDQRMWLRAGGPPEDDQTEHDEDVRGRVEEPPIAWGPRDSPRWSVPIPGACQHVMPLQNLVQDDAIEKAAQAQAQEDAGRSWKALGRSACPLAADRRSTTRSRVKRGWVATDRLQDPGGQYADELRWDQSIAASRYLHRLPDVDRLSFRCRMSLPQTRAGEPSLYALAKSAVAVSQLCYSPSRGEGRNGRRLALAR